MDWLWAVVVLGACGLGFLTGLLTGFTVDGWCRSEVTALDIVAAREDDENT